MYDAEAQAISLPSATRLRTHWTQAELDSLQALKAAGVPDRVAATELHRSLYGVRYAKQNPLERANHAPAQPRQRGAFDRGFTSLEEMGF